MAGPRAQTVFFRSAKARSSSSAQYRAWQEDMLIWPHVSRTASGPFFGGPRFRSPPSPPGPGPILLSVSRARGVRRSAPVQPGDGPAGAAAPRARGRRTPCVALKPGRGICDYHNSHTRRRRHACRPSLLLPAMGAKRGAGAQGVAAQCRRPARRTERRADAGRGRHQTSWARRGTPGRGKATSVNHTERKARDSGFADASAPGRG